jgi:glycosyltransferase involved in cell wall biosynthesis
MSQNVDGRPAQALRVCHIVATTQGANWVFEQLRELRDRHGMDVTAIVSGESGPLVDLLRTADIRVVAWDFGMERGKLGELPPKIVGLAKFLRRERFDVVQTHVFPSMMIGRIAAWLADVPLRLAMVAGPFHLQAEGSRAIDRDTCFMDHILIASCQLTREMYREMGVREDSLALIYYGADPERFDPRAVEPSGVREESGWPAWTAVVGMIAYFYERLKPAPWVPRDLWGRGVKGHDEFVKATKIVLEQFPETKFLVVGGGFTETGNRYRGEVLALAERLGVSSNITFTGHRANIPAILKDIDISVQPSLNENLGGVLESLLMARPTVATRVGGMVDGVKDGETGILVTPGDPADLARGILELLRDPERAALLGRKGRQLMLDRFTLERTAADLASLYTSNHRRGSYSAGRSLLRAVGALPVAAYLTVRLRWPESGLVRRWDRLRGRGS